MKEEKWGTQINRRRNRFLSSMGTRWGQMGDNNEMGKGKVVKQDKEEEEWSWWWWWWWW